MSELHELPALALRDLLRRGTVSAADAAAHFLARIEQQNPLLGAFITVTGERALEEARAADELRSRSGDAADLPLLHGMPLAFKDLTDVAGVVTTHGSAALDNKPAPANSPLVSLFKEAGAITLGKTQVPEFGLTAYSENRIAPPSRNPHAPSRSSGGSSGGSAAAVAAGLVPFAPGTDGGGSVRIPAAACGLVGLKPGRGLVAAGESAGDPARLVVPGPLARSTEDAALMMDAMVPGGQYLQSVGQEPGKMRIGVTLDSPWAVTFPFTVEQEARDALRSGVTLLEDAGHILGDAAIRYDNRYPDAFTTAWTAGVGAARISPTREALLAPLTRTFRRRAQQRSAAKLAEALAFLRQFQHDTLAQYGQWDLMLMLPWRRRRGPWAGSPARPTAATGGRPHSGPGMPTATTGSSANTRRGPPW